MRATYVAAATYGYAALPLQTVLSFGVGSVGWLLWCVPMARSAFGRPTAILGAIVNVIGIIGAAAPVVTSSILGWCQFLAPPLIGLWRARATTTTTTGLHSSLTRLRHRVHDAYL